MNMLIAMSEIQQRNMPVTGCKTGRMAQQTNTRILLTMALSTLVLFLFACTSQSEDNTRLRLVELQSENTKLTEQLATVTHVIEKIEENQSGQNVQRSIPAPVKFDDSGDTVERIKDRKVLHCGGNADLPGFGYLSPASSQFVGFDIDICRAIAAAVLGRQGTNTFEITPLTSKLRFTALQSGRVDVLTRNTTWTLSRDTELRVEYAGVSFYDGQDLLVRESSKIKKLSDLRDKSVCVQAGSTSERNIADYYQSQGINVEIVSFEDRVAALEKYIDGGCDGYTADSSSLAAQLTLVEDATDHRFLNAKISREPLGPVVRHGDENWKDVVSWTLQCMLNGELLGVSQKNIEDHKDSTNPAIQALLGQSGDLGAKMGLSNNFCYEVIAQVGNYKDIYDRHLGTASKLNIPRTTNALYTAGGLHYPLPFR